MLAQSSDCPPFLLFLFSFLLCAKPLEPFMQRQSHNEAKKNRDKKDVPCPQLVVAMRRLLGTWKTETSSLESTDLNCYEESPPQVCRHPAGFADLHSGTVREAFLEEAALCGVSRGYEESAKPPSTGTGVYEETHVPPWWAHRQPVWTCPEGKLECTFS